MKINIRTLSCIAALAATFPVFAQEEDADTVETAAESAEKKVKHISEIDDRVFTALPYCKRLEGKAEVLKPGSGNWEKIDEGRFFPLGSSYRTCNPDSRLEIAFGREAVVSIVGLASFGTRQQPLEVKSRTITLGSGVIEVRLAQNFPEKMFCITNDGFYVENPAGVSRYAYSRTGDGGIATIRCVSGVLTVKGRHFVIPSMHAANEVEILSSQDYLMTRLVGKSGDYICELDGGLLNETDFEQHKEVPVPKTLLWKLSPQTAVRIFRKVPEVGGNLAVSVMTFNANGELMNRCSYTENRAEINTGDQGPAVKKDRERAAKALQEAAAAVETTEEASSEEAESDSAGEESPAEAAAPANSDDDF